MTVCPLTCPLSPKKRSYATEGGAAMAAAHLNGLCHRDDGDPGVEPYHCPTEGGCGRWHLRDLRKRTDAGRRELDPEGYRLRKARKRKARKEHLRENRPEKYAADKARLRKNSRANRRQRPSEIPSPGRVGPLRMRIRGLAGRAITNYWWAGGVDDVIAGTGAYAAGDRVLAYDPETMHLAEAVVTECRDSYVSLDIDRTTLRQVEAFDFPIPKYELGDRLSEPTHKE